MKSGGYDIMMILPLRLCYCIIILDSSLFLICGATTAHNINITTLIKPHPAIPLEPVELTCTFQGIDPDVVAWTDSEGSTLARIVSPKFGNSVRFIEVGTLYQYPFERGEITTTNHEYDTLVMNVIFHRMCMKNPFTCKAWRRSRFYESKIQVDFFPRKVKPEMTMSKSAYASHLEPNEQIFTCWTCNLTHRHELVMQITVNGARDKTMRQISVLDNRTCFYSATLKNAYRVGSSDTVDAHCQVTFDDGVVMVAEAAKMVELTTTPAPVTSYLIADEPAPEPTYFTTNRIVGIAIGPAIIVACVCLVGFFKYAPQHPVTEEEKRKASAKKKQKEQTKAMDKQKQMEKNKTIEKKKQIDQKYQKIDNKKSKSREKTPNR